MIRYKCRYCDGDFNPAKLPIGELVCPSCGAEWNSIEFDYNEEELRNENAELDSWFALHRDDDEDRPLKTSKWYSTI